MNEKLDRLLDLLQAAERLLETAKEAGDDWLVSNDALADLDEALAPYRGAKTARYAEDAR